jgi:alanyl-tRNA synthetase
MPLIEAVAQLSGKPYVEDETAVAMRVIADHLRALSFAIARRRHAVQRRPRRRPAPPAAPRRALRPQHRPRWKPFLCKLFPVLEKQMGGFLPELTARREEIVRALRAEENPSPPSLDRGIAHFDETSPS